MKSLLVAIFISFVIVAPVLAETDAELEAERLRLQRWLEEFQLEMEKNKVVLLDKGTDWSRYRLRSGELVIDGSNNIDLSDQKAIGRIIDSVQTLRRYGKACDVVTSFRYKRVPMGIGRTKPKSRVRCKRNGCYEIREFDRIEYGRRKNYINVTDRCHVGEF